MTDHSAAEKHYAVAAGEGNGDPRADDGSGDSRAEGMSRKRTLLVSLAVLAVGVAVTALIFLTEPTAERSGAVRETAMLVDVVTVEKGNFTPTIRATGTVEPSQDIMLSPRVQGEIIELSENFTPGGYVQKGEVLLRIDPADYQNALDQRLSELEQAEANLLLEEGRQQVARRELARLPDTLSEENRKLVLRVPQMNTAKATLKSAKAAVEQARLNLKRTTVTAPFDAHILTRTANVGSQVAPGTVLARLVGIEEYWVVATLPVAQLRWLSFADQQPDNASEVRIYNHTAWGAKQYRTGTLQRLLGSLENQTRLARVLISVNDPLARSPQNNDKPSLILEAFVQAEITARPLKEVVRLNRDYIRKDDTVWLMKNDTLSIARPDILFRDATHAYITRGVEDGDRVVTTNLATVVEGAKLRLE